MHSLDASCLGNVGYRVGFMSGDDEVVVNGRLLHIGDCLAQNGAAAPGEQLFGLLPHPFALTGRQNNGRDPLVHLKYGLRQFHCANNYPLDTGCLQKLVGNLAGGVKLNGRFHFIDKWHHARPGWHVLQSTLRMRNQPRYITH